MALGPADLYFGALPDDPRAFNAVCVCPPPGGIPQGYRRVILLGCPAEWLPGDVRAYRLETRPNWVRCLPDLDDMRDAYRALMEVCRRPARVGSLQQLAQITSELCGLSRLSALMSLVAIEDMGLFEFDFNASPARVRRLNRKKAEPDESAAWRIIQHWKQENL